MSATRLDASTTFCDAFASADLARETAMSLNCGEVDALATLLEAHGYPASADYWVQCHSEGHDEGDEEHTRQH
ncbi:hypothetical protein [Microbacterium sp. BF1]|uniref:hypothetical protein n=1 Tax=Microbacterium sp. BF1 TaxID=2821146 RepID=UPI001C4DDC15|nr:hypothetical protein [Microbacterium sp. BF1]